MSEVTLPGIPPSYRDEIISSILRWRLGKKMDLEKIPSHLATCAMNIGIKLVDSTDTGKFVYYFDNPVQDNYCPHIKLHIQDPTRERYQLDITIIYTLTQAPDHQYVITGVGYQCERVK